MKSESKKFTPIVEKKPLRKWLISFEIYRVTQSILYDKGTTVIEAENLEQAYNSLRKENFKLYITNVYEL